MVWCVHLHEFKAYLAGIGFFFVNEDEGQRLYARGHDILVVRTSGHQTETEMNRACDIAGVDPPKIQPFFGPPQLA